MVKILGCAAVCVCECLGNMVAWSLENMARIQWEHGGVITWEYGENMVEHLTITSHHRSLPKYFYPILTVKPTVFHLKITQNPTNPSHFGMILAPKYDRITGDIPGSRPAHTVKASIVHSEHTVSTQRSVLYQCAASVLHACTLSRPVLSTNCKYCILYTSARSRLSCCRQWIPQCLRCVL